MIGFGGNSNSAMQGASKKRLPSILPGHSGSDIPDGMLFIQAYAP